MSFEAEAAVSAGLIGGVAMALVLYMGIAMAPNQMRMNLFYILGTMNLPRGSETAVYMLGAMVHEFARVGRPLRPCPLDHSGSEPVWHGLSASSDEKRRP